MRYEKHTLDCFWGSRDDTLYICAFLVHSGHFENNFFYLGFRVDITIFLTRDRVMCVFSRFCGVCGVEKCALHKINMEGQTLQGGQGGWGEQG